MATPEHPTRWTAWLDGELDAAEEARLEAHLAGCADCRAAVDSLRILHGALADLPAPTTADLWPSVAARVGRRERRVGPAAWVGYAAVLLLGIALGGWVGSALPAAPAAEETLLADSSLAGLPDDGLSRAWFEEAE
jgi:anti-sigma factor RsiW